MDTDAYGEIKAMAKVVLDHYDSTMQYVKTFMDVARTFRDKRRMWVKTMSGVGNTFIFVAV